MLIAMVCAMTSAVKVSGVEATTVRQTPFTEIEVLDGEMVAGMVLGWNFGDGHLHDERFLGILQDACGFAPGEVRAVLIEGQALGSPTLDWRIVDAATGAIARGRIVTADLLDHQPWEADGLALHSDA